MTQRLSRERERKKKGEELGFRGQAKCPFLPKDVVKALTGS